MKLLIRLLGSAIALSPDRSFFSLFERGCQFKYFATGTEIGRISPTSHFLAVPTHTPLHMSEGFGTEVSS